MPANVVAQRGKKQVRAITSAERERSGWINEDIFVDYLRHIVNHTRCSLENTILLILDNHESRVSLQAIDFARAS